METRSDWVVHKFGGTSVAGAERYRHVAELMAHEPGAKKAIVVSAMSGVTDALLGLVTLAKRRDTYQDKLEALRARHVATARELLPPAEAARLAAVVRERRARHRRRAPRHLARQELPRS